MVTWPTVARNSSATPTFRLSEWHHLQPDIETENCDMEDGGRFLQANDGGYCKRMARQSVSADTQSAFSLLLLTTALLLRFVHGRRHSISRLSFSIHAHLHHRWTKSFEIKKRSQEASSHKIKIYILQSGTTNFRFTIFWVFVTS